MAHASKKGKGMGDGSTVGHQHVGTTDPEILDETDLAGEIKGNNRLQGSDQKRVRNERRSAPPNPAETPEDSE